MLEWEGGNDVYEGGKRDVATLYEYWLFFALVDLVSKKFSLPVRSLNDLIEKTGDRFGLKLKAGRHIPVQGVFENGNSRKLHIRFSYNRTFARLSSDASDNLESNYPAAGSWTRRMRPDYTLSLWPVDYSEEEAETKELIVHIHFDAKYRVEALSDLFGNDTEEEIEEEKRAKNEGRTAKRDDLLKMHAYRDAIRRTEGAYVLYPGTETVKWRGFHEILPGLGAFAVIPGEQSGLNELSRFLDDIVLQASNRAAQQERNSYHVYHTHIEPRTPSSLLKLPEQEMDGSRRTPPIEVFVLAGWCKSQAEIDATLSRYHFILHLPDNVAFTPALASVRYIVFYLPGSIAIPGLWRVVGDGPRLITGTKDPIEGMSVESAENIYAVYEFEPAEQELQGWIWDPGNLAKVGFEDDPVSPIVLTLDTLMQAVHGI